MYRAKIAILEEEAIRLRVGGRGSCGFGMSRIGRIQNLGNHKPLSFPKKTVVFGYHIVVWVSYSQRFF